MRNRFDLWRDTVLYAVSGGFCLLAFHVSSVPVYRQWAALASGPYVAGAVAGWLLAVRRTGLRGRTILAGLVFVGAVLVPLALEIAWGPHAAPVQHVQSETLVTEEAAKALVHGRDPYATRYLRGPLAAWPIGTKSHYPYLPLMLLFGLPRAAWGAAITDGRVAFLAGGLAALTVALSLAQPMAGRALLVFQILIVLPTGAMLLVGGGDDVVVVAMMLAALALMASRRSGIAGFLAGVAASMKQLAWPLLPFVVLWAKGRPGTRPRARALAGAALPTAGSIVPFLVWNAGRFLDDVIRFPLGFGKPATHHPTPTPGVLLARAIPQARGAIGIAAGVVVAASLVWFLMRAGDRTAQGAARGAAVVILAGILLAPSSRIGFVVYPANLLVWAFASRRPADTISAMAASTPADSLVVRPS